MTTLFDRPIDGGISHYGSRTMPEQHAPEELLKALDAVLNIKGVEAVRWTQYTPYFNDGDACEFGLNDVRVRVTGGDEEAGDHKDGYITTYEMLGDYNYVGSWPNSRLVVTSWKSIEGVDVPALYEALEALGREHAHHEVLLKMTFGDPAEVTATKAGFQVEHYEHD